MLPGTFDKHPKNSEKQSVLLGYLARAYRTEWHNILGIAEKKLNKTGLVDALKDIDEWTDIIAILLKLFPYDQNDPKVQQNKESLGEFLDMLSMWVGK